ncbi:MAG: protein kinase [Elusimicrobia bacterium]|nr:protein kinase [Elusimicrobiota bacterium]
MVRARVRASLLCLAAGLILPAAAQDQPAPVPRVSAPLSAKVNPRHKDGAWSAMSPAQSAAVLKFIEGAPDRAAAEADFVHLGWRLLMLRELQENPEGLSPADIERRRSRMSRRLDELVAAMAPASREALLPILGPSLRAAGYAPPSTVAPAIPAPVAAPELAPPAPEKSGLPGLAPAAYYDALRRSQKSLREGDWRTAEAAARRAEALAPAEIGAGLYKALALSMQERHEEAVAEVKTMLRIRPSSWFQGPAAFVFNRAKRFEEAQKAVEASVAGRPDRGWLWYQLAYAQAGQGDREESLRSLEQAVRLEPRDFTGRLRAARAAPDLPAFFASDPALETVSLLRGDPAGWARRRFWRSLAWPAAAVVLLIALFWVRKPFAAWLVRFGMAAAGTPLPTPMPTPISGLPAQTGPGLSLPGLPSGYRVLRQIGSGGMGAVYEAEDVSLQRRVAVKRMRDEIRDDPRERDRFLKEARTVAQLRHPSIVDIHGIFEHEGEVFLVFEFLDGKTLDLVVYENGRLSLPEVKPILNHVCSALTYAHARGVIHRDLKPPNIMLTRDNRVKVMDFGVARQAHEALSRLSVSATVAGTPPYMAPESETGTVRAESDLYSLAVCLYEMLSGARPFDGTSAGMLYSKMNMVFTPASRKTPGLPPAVDGFFARALHADPEKRPRTAAAFLAEFLAAAGETRP